MVALSDILYDDSESSKFDFMSIIGMLCLLISLMFQGFVFTYQEKLLDDYEIRPLQMVGMESMMGAIVCTILILITSTITCKHPEFCNAKDAQPIDSPPYSLYDLRLNYAWVYFMLTAFSIMIFNFVGLIITKNAGSVFRVILDTLRTITIWILSVIISFETLSPPLKIIIEIFGFVLLILGNLIYNEIIVIRFCGLDRHVNRQALNDEENEENDQNNEDLNQNLLGNE